jgi:putative addiction module component (TIGR02574 family)
MARGDSLLAEALHLPMVERARLALRLAESLDDTIDPDAEQAWASEVGRRVELLRAGELGTVSADEAFEAAEASLAARRG